MTDNHQASILAGQIAHRILVLRGQKVLLDADLAKLYGVETRVLVQAVKRNLERFPEDFMFQLTWEEVKPLRSQFVILNAADPEAVTEASSTLSSPDGPLKRGANRKYRPYAFSEQGIAMLSSVLRSPQAIAVNIEIMRAFVQLREAVVNNRELSLQFEALARKVDSHDQAIVGILEAIRELMKPSEPVKKRSIGFVTEEEKPKKGG